MSTEIDNADLLECAIRTARTAGDHALANRERRVEVVKLSRHDVKLKLDLECQARAESVIRSEYPDHDILGEEDVDAPAADTKPAAVEWIIDPIDGTVNFWHGLPLWCTSVAVRTNGRVVAGAVYAPDIDELYSASEGGGAFCNGQPLAVSETAKLEQALVTTGMDKDVHPELPPFALFNTIAALR